MSLLHYTFDGILFLIIHGIIFLGIACVLASYSFFPEYKLILLPIAIILILFGTFMEGREAEKKSYQLMVEEWKLKIKDAEENSNKINTVVETKVIEKIKYVKEKTDANKQYLDKYVTKYDDLCTIANSAIVLHNGSSQDTVAKGTGNTNEGTSDVKLSELLKTVSENYGLYYQAREQVIGWQQWYKEQKKIYESIK